MRWMVIVLSIFAVACGPDSNSETGSDGGVSSSNNGTSLDAGFDAATTDDAATTEDAADMGGADMTAEVDEGTPTPVDTSPLDVMDRPADVFVPDDYDDATAYPLLILLHGYSANAMLQDFYFGTSQRTSERDFVLVTPDGTANVENKKFWNGYWCCDFYNQEVDDVAYISGLIASAKERFNIDPKRVYLLGHSNGGFMSYRMACEVDGIAAIASLAGSGAEQEADCEGRNVSILQMHGSVDTVIPYDGAAGQFPSAREMMRRWAERNGCDAESTTGESLDFVRALSGAETVPETWDNCVDGTTVELWTIEGGAHIPTPNDDFKDGILDFLLSQEAP